MERSVGGIFQQIVQNFDEWREQAKKRAEARRKRRAEEETAALEESIREMKRKREAKQILYQQREPLRQEIRAMPEYNIWRKAVLSKSEGRCQQTGGSHIGALEAHHLTSLDSIVRKHRIQNAEQAQKCKALWDPDNGETLCEWHHDRTESSLWRRYYESKEASQ